MTNSVAASLIRYAGVCGIVGGPALAVAYLAHPPSATPAVVSSAFWIWVHLGFMASLLGGVFLLFGLLARYFAAGGGYAGFVGFAFAVVSLIFVFGLDYAEVFIFPTLAVSHPDVVVQYDDGTSMPSVAFAFPAAGVMFLIGFVMFAWTLREAGVVSQNGSILTIAGTIIFALGLSGFFPMIVVKIGAAIFGTALVWLGTALWNSKVAS